MFLLRPSSSSFSSMPRARPRKRAGPSHATHLPAHRYQPIGQATEQATQPRLFWPGFRRRRINEAKSQLDGEALDDDGNCDDEETFRIGDVVMVKHTTPLPVVGLITQIWTLPDAQADGAQDDDDEDDDDDDDFVPLWCKIRFFYWPELLSGSTKARMRGLLNPAEIFYTHRLPRLVPSSRRSNRSLAAAEAPVEDTFQAGPSLLESDGFTVTEILGRAHIHPTLEAANDAARVDTRALLHQGKVVPRHLFCGKAVDPMKELFWHVDYASIHAKGKEGKGWDVPTKESDFKGRALTEWADAEKKRLGIATTAGKRGATAAATKRIRVKPIKRSRRASSTSDEDSSSSDEDGDGARSDDGNFSGESSDDSDSSEDDDDDASTAATSEDEEDYDDDSGYGARRKRKRTIATRPRPRVAPRRLADLRRSAREQLQDRSQATSSGALLPDPISSLPYGFASQSALEAMSPTERALRLLHVSTTPSRLPCRTKQAEDLLCLLEDSLDTGIGSCIYISGVPGTGKTATVRGVIAQLQRRAEVGQVNPFDFLEINGMRVADAGEAYSMLWGVVGGSSGSGTRRSPKAALGLLSRHYAATTSSTALGPGRAATIVLMDELDQLLTSRQDVMYNLFNWPSARNSRLIVIAVANTMDLPERTMSPKVASRLGMTRITFMPYADRELGEIVRSRLRAPQKDASELVEEGGEEGDKAHALMTAAVAGCSDLFANEAITYAAKRISNVSGDARRMLDVCRRSLESTPTGQKVSIANVRSVLDGMVKSSRPSHISRSLSLHGKVLLVSLLALLRKTGLAEISLADLSNHHRALCRLHDVGAAGALLALNQLVSLGLVILVGSAAGPGKAAGQGRVLLSTSLREDEVRLALEGDEDRRVRGMF